MTAQILEGESKFAAWDFPPLFCTITGVIGVLCWKIGA